MSVSAKVTVTLEIGVRSGWSATTTMDQIYKQAVVDADGMLREWAAKLRAEHEPGFRIIGEPTIEAVMVKDKRP